MAMLMLFNVAVFVLLVNPIVTEKAQSADDAASRAYKGPTYPKTFPNDSVPYVDPNPQYPGPYLGSARRRQLNSVTSDSGIIGTVHPQVPSANLKRPHVKLERITTWESFQLDGKRFFIVPAGDIHWPSESP